MGNIKEKFMSVSVQVVYLHLLTPHRCQYCTVWGHSSRANMQGVVINGVEGNKFWMP